MWQVMTDGGFTRFRRMTEVPINWVFEVGAEGTDSQYSFQARSFPSLLSVSKDFPVGTGSPFAARSKGSRQLASTPNP